MRNILVGVASMLLLPCCGEVEAGGSFAYLSYADLRLGVLYTHRLNAQCQHRETRKFGVGGKSKIVSNLGVDVSLVKYNNHSINFNYTHTSCVFQNDFIVDDNVGLSYTVRLWGL